MVKEIQLKVKTTSRNITPKDRICSVVFYEAFLSVDERLFVQGPGWCREPKYYWLSGLSI